MKWLLLALGAALAVVPVRTEIVLDRASMPADGRSTARAQVVHTSLAGVAWPSSSPLSGAALLRASDGSWVLRAGHAPGFVDLAAGSARAQVELIADPSDTDLDGLPDAAELLGEEDRAAFSAWFTAIAESQSRRLDDAWPRVHQDCAGLVRFAAREALKKHDGPWLAKRDYLGSISAPDVAAFNYPDIPFIGDLPFRSRGGAFSESDRIADTFTAAPSARTLWQNASTLVSRDLADARPGDLLFFATSSGGLHTMIALGARPGATPIDRVTRVVYHTGQDGAGEVRVVTLADLRRHPDAGWHPTADNARFLGIHRLNLIHHESRTFARWSPP